MARNELSISEKYGQNNTAWQGLWPGVREFVQNGLDGQTDGYPLVVEHKAGYLHLRNVGCQLTQNVWLMGETDKADNADMIGEHGDGLKMGALSLSRQGVEIKIYNADEIWNVAIEPSQKYLGKNLLTIRSRKRRQDRWGDRPMSDFTVMIKIPKDEWLGMQSRFLALVDIQQADIAHVPYRGDVLLSPAMQGRVYVKGIFVCDKPGLCYGYNFEDMQINRDRTVVDTWDLEWAVNYLMRDLCGVDGEDNTLWLTRLYEVLSQGDSAEFKRVGNLDSTPINEAMAATFADTHGAKAVPVANEGEATKVSFYGLKGVVVPSAMGSVLEHTFGDLAKILATALDTSGVYVQVSDMNHEERINWTKAINLCDYADIADTDYLRSSVKCYSYSAPDAPLGTHHNGEERINRCLLGSLRRLVGVMIHEIAHNAGRDGTLAHRESEESMYEAVMGCLLDMAGTEWLLD